MINVLSVPTLVVYIIGVPVFFLSSLRKNPDENHFIAIGMSKEFYYWEVVIMQVKAVVICLCEVMTTVSNEVQVLTSIIIFLLHLIFTLKLKPMSTLTSNRM